MHVSLSLSLYSLSKIPFSTLFQDCFVLFNDSYGLQASKKTNFHFLHGSKQEKEETGRGGEGMGEIVSNSNVYA